MLNKISRLDRLSLWGTGLKAGLAAIAAGFVFTTLSTASAQPPAEAPPAVEAPVEAAPPVETVAPEAAAPEAVVEEAVEEAPALTVDKGDTAWMLVSTVLVLLMIIPGLALFYGGLVRSKNMISLLSQVLIVTAIGMIAWVGWGYSMAFTDGGGINSFVGGFSKVGLAGVDTSTLVETFSVGVAIPEIVFVAFQMTFACITTALVLGGVAERAKFWGVVLFAVLWPIVVYYPMAHMVWWWGGPIMASDPANAEALVAGAGLIWSFGALDFAGGTVVHINSGIAALVGALILGKRKSYKSEPIRPHNLTFTLIGTGLLWVGWVGFKRRFEPRIERLCRSCADQHVRRDGCRRSPPGRLPRLRSRRSRACSAWRLARLRVLLRSRLPPASPVRSARSCSA